MACFCYPLSSFTQRLGDFSGLFDSSSVDTKSWLFLLAWRSSFFDSTRFFPSENICQMIVFCLMRLACFISSMEGLILSKTIFLTRQKQARSSLLTCSRSCPLIKLRSSLRVSIVLASSSSISFLTILCMSKLEIQYLLFFSFSIEAFLYYSQTILFFRSFRNYLFFQSEERAVNKQSLRRTRFYCDSKLSRARRFSLGIYDTRGYEFSFRGSLCRALSPCKPEGF